VAGRRGSIRLAGCLSALSRLTDAGRLGVSRFRRLLWSALVCRGVHALLLPECVPQRPGLSAAAIVNAAVYVSRACIFSFPPYLYRYLFCWWLVKSGSVFFFDDLF